MSTKVTHPFIAGGSGELEDEYNAVIAAKTTDNLSDSNKLDLNIKRFLLPDMGGIRICQATITPKGTSYNISRNSLYNYETKQAFSLPNEFSASSYKYFLVWYGSQDVAAGYYIASGQITYPSNLTDIYFLYRSSGSYINWYIGCKETGSAYSASIDSYNSVQFESFTGWYLCDYTPS